MSKIKVDSRADGVYIVVDNTDPSEKVSRKMLLDAIEANNLKNVDFAVVNEILKSDEPRIEKKVSDKAGSMPVKENVDIEIARDRLTATAKFTPPQFGGESLTRQEIDDRIKIAEVTFGLNEEAIASLAVLGANKDFAQKHIIAEGKPPVAGADGQTIYNYDISGEKNQPKILGDGTVDYKQISYFEPVTVGQVLIERVDPTEGEEGMDVQGKIIPARPGKPAPKLTKGKNTIITEDELRLVAETAGQLVVSGKQVSVSPVLTIKGDVDFSTGNIDFEGSVDIQGAVVSGFTVTAAGNIEVKGVVEEAVLTAEGSINLYGGIMGRGKGRVESGCNIFTKFAQNATIISRASIKTNSLLHSAVSAEGSIILEGDNCFIAGGVITAGDEIRAKTIGSRTGTMTEIIVGHNNELTMRLEEVDFGLKAAEEQYIKLNAAYDAFTKVMNIDDMDSKRKAQLLQLMQQRNLHRDRAQELEEEKNIIQEAIRRIKGRVVAERVIYAGVKVSIGAAQKQLNDDITVSVLQNEGGLIKARPFVE